MKPDSGQQVKKAVIPAGGLGSRLLPITRTIPKEMLLVVDRPVIQYVLEEAVGSSINELLLVTREGKQSILDYFRKRSDLNYDSAKSGARDAHESLLRIIDNSKIHSAIQSQPLGLGHAILEAQDFCAGEPFGVLLADDIYLSTPPLLKQLALIYERFPGVVLAIQEVPWSEVSNYGIVRVESMPSVNDSRLMRVLELREKPSKREIDSNLAIMGRYILPSEIFNALRSTPPGALGELQLTDAVSTLLRMRIPVLAYRFDGLRFEVGDVRGFLTANMAVSRLNALAIDDCSVGKARDNA